VGILEAQLQLKGKILTVFCAHFMNPLDEKIWAWPRQITTRAAIREAQWQLLQSVAQNVSTPVLIAGDFNTPPRGALYRQIAARFEDGFAASSRGFGCSFPAFVPLERLDYFWTPRGKSARMAKCRVLRSRASDHRALAGELEFLR
jgi:vancomycin resistance protein VanJ